jgi:uncharacterized protein (TIGR02099 family)
MSPDQHHATPPTGRLAKCWRIVRVSYRRLNRATFHVLGFTLKLLLAAYFIFCVLFLALRYAVLPEVARYKPEIEKLASKAVGRTVAIQGIEASWSGLRPQLALTNVTIRDEGRQAELTLPDVQATLSWTSILAAGLRLENLTINHADLAIRRDAAGKLYVAGIPVPDSKEHGGAQWVLSQREIVIRNGKLRWLDEQRNAPELALDDVNLVLHNQWLQHKLALKATPPLSYAAPLDVRADFSHPAFASNIADVSRWKGMLYADLRNTDLAVWRAFVDYPIEITQGSGSVRAWLTLDRAKIANFTADLALQNFSARLSKKLEPLSLRRVDGRISASESLGPTPEDGVPTFGANGHKVTLSNFSVETEDGFQLPPTSISEVYEPATRLHAEKMSVQASVLDLAALSQMAARLPLSPSQRQLLSDLDPRGRLQDFTMQWQGTYPDVDSFQVRGKFSGLGLKPQARHVETRKTTPLQTSQVFWPATPGFDNLNGQIDATEKGGTLSLASTHVSIQPPLQSVMPVMPFDKLNLRAHWALQKDQTMLFQVDDMDFAQAGVAGRLSGTHIMPLNGKSAGVIDINARISEFDVKTMARYLPLNMAPPLHNWLTKGLMDGTVRDAQIVVKGALADFPFHTAKPGDKPKGQFSVSGKFDGLKVNYTPGHLNKEGREPEWPLLEDGRGQLLIDRTRLEIHADTAKTRGAALTDVKAVVPDLLAADSVLEIDGNAAAPMQTLLNYLNDSPVARWIGNATEQTTSSGNGKLQLKFQMPLHHAIDTRAEGALLFTNNDVDLMPTLPVMYRTNGKLEFNEKGFTLNGIRGQFLGDNVAVTGGTQHDGSTQVKLEGMVAIDGLRKSYTEPMMQRLLAHVSGSARYTASVIVRQHRPEVIVESNLLGLGMNFPTPLVKAANESMPLRFELQTQASNDALVQRDEVKFALGQLLASRYVRQRVASKSDEWQVLSGGIGLGQPAPQPASGLAVQIGGRALNLDEWLSFKTEIKGGKSVTQSGETAGGKPGIRASGVDLDQYLEPDSVSVRVPEVTLKGSRIGNVNLNAVHRENVWQINLDSDQASGNITWSESRSGRGAGRLNARLSRLVIQKGSVADTSGDSADKSSTDNDNGDAQIPALDIMADDFQLFGKKLGKLELNANNVRVSVGREWRINRLTLSNEDAEFRAAGNWMSFGKSNDTNMTYALDVHDAGKLLERFGFHGVVRSGAGKLDGDISWKGAPFQLDIPSLSGQVHVDMHGGQFLKVEPGAAKLLGVLNLQALPRRLALDFRDVFSEGFAFDNIVGTAAIAQGVATTDNLKMTGVTASVLMNGSANIARETQDLHLVVIPEINLGTASVVAMAINPVVGVGTLLAQLFLRNPVMKSLTFEYKVSGSWSDPVVVKQEHKTDGTTAPKTGSDAAANAMPAAATH